MHIRHALRQYRDPGECIGNPITENLKIGTLGELLVQLRLLEHGVQAAPPIKDSGNDLIAVCGETFRGIQVKTTAGQRVTGRRLPKHYHILALVHLIATDTDLLLDRSRIFLLPREAVDRTKGRVPPDFEQYELNAPHVAALFNRRS
jgi:hypothetical protein